MSKRNVITLRQTNLYEEARRRYEELLQIKQVKEMAIAKAPPERVHIIKSNHSSQFYLRCSKKETNGVYVPKAELARIRIFLQKNYDEKVLKLIKQELPILESFLKKSNDFSNRIQKSYSNLPTEAKTFIHPLDMSDDDFINSWQSMPYEGKALPDYVPFYETNRKEMVRSKSELNIANALAEHGIPYKYECPLQLINGVTIYPDFTVLSVRGRREIYWEHRGMMDDKEYAKGSVQRMKMLMQNGIFLGQNLVITEETSTNPLGTNEINAVIENYF